MLAPSAEPLEDMVNEEKGCDFQHVHDTEEKGWSKARVYGTSPWQHLVSPPRQSNGSWTMMRPTHHQEPLRPFHLLGRHPSELAPQQVASSARILSHAVPAYLTGGSSAKGGIFIQIATAC